ncbi:polyamine ABC transporter substrate-binding protein [Pseudofrankia inefficax]|uniref:Extracellular solute-binding protein family 1 n=1 Tax=Pseudofrankia inefficax (strain DSM 45817 / CECT 9037 / DDB 130130 / EuI1c) TaxID=298654 RepID=E3J283_PSEI1|nr:spermidine/putrescine ABC transporter substrate-binding protein [Pseudofrankia inefficax]ADP78121.1 extracellular solute-binding protein family 1 [Pseudofrankia inefficax]
MTTHDSTDRPGAQSPPPAVDPALLRGLTQPRLGRRQFLQAGGAAGLAAFLAACGVKGEKKAPATADDVATFWSDKKKAGTLDFANWPLYMDTDDAGKHPSLVQFEKDTGIHVNYRESIQDNGEYFAKVQPQLAAHQSISADLIVITNGVYLDKFIELGFLAPLDQTKLPTFAKNADPSVKNPSYDKGNKYTVAWQSGLVGIGYDPEKTGREITSYEDLFDPAFKGHVGMFGDNEDLPNFCMVGMGIKPETSTEADWKNAAAKLTKQRDDGIVRKYYDQGYIDALASGDLWLSMAWSGDVYQQQAGGKNLKFVVPKEGGLFWTDNMCIPITAAHPVDAITYMDYVYKPDVAAMLTDYINYITPVPGAKSLVDPALSGSPLIFPTADDLKKTYRYRDLTAAEEKTWNSIFQPIVQS